MIHMFRHHRKLLPLDLPSISFINQSDIHNYNTRHVSDLHIAPTNPKLARNAITTQGPIIWNTPLSKIANLWLYLRHVWTGIYLINAALKFTITCMRKLDNFFTVLYATTVLNVLSRAVLHPNLNLIWFFSWSFIVVSFFFWNWISYT